MVPSFFGNASIRACISRMSASYFNAFTASCGLASAADALSPAGRPVNANLSLSYHDSTTTVGCVLLSKLASPDKRVPWSYHDATFMVVVALGITGLRIVLKTCAAAAAGMSAAVKSVRIAVAPTIGPSEGHRDAFRVARARCPRAGHTHRHVSPTRSCKATCDPPPQGVRVIRGWDLGADDFSWNTSAYDCE